MREQTGRPLVDLQSDLTAWLNEPGVLMMDQYALVRIVCQQAERYFSVAIKEELSPPRRQGAKKI